MIELSSKYQRNKLHQYATGLLTASGSIFGIDLTTLDLSYLFV